MNHPRKPNKIPDKSRLKAKKLSTIAPGRIAKMPAGDMRRLVRELQVRQIELEIQNDELFQTQRASEIARDRLLLPYDAAPVGFLSMDDDGIIHESNLATARLLNHDRSQLSGRKLSDFVVLSSQDTFYLYRRQLSRSDEKYICELSMAGKNGSPFVARLETVQDSAWPGPKIRWLVMISDVTERKRVEEELRRSEYHLQNFFNLAPIGLAWLSPVGTILRVNQAQLDLLGYSMEEYVGHSFLDFGVDLSQGQEFLDRLAKKEIVRNLRMVLRRKDGTICQVLVDANPFWSGKRFQYSSIFLRDITDRIKLEHEILHISEREHRRIAQDLHDGLGQLLVGAAYVAGTLRQDLKTKSPAAARKAARIGEVLADAIRQTRDLSQGLHPVEAEPTGLMSALEALAIRTKKLFNIRCHFSCRHPVLVQDNMVATHLFRIAQEAITNAIKHGKPGGIEIGLTTTPGRIILAIKDNGRGLPNRQRKRAGMGLRIMRYRAGMSDGSLALQKTPGGGTTVVCTIHLSGNNPQQVPYHSAKKRTTRKD